MSAEIAQDHGRAPFSPREIVSELDRYIVGQNEAKRAVAIALRNRWRRQQLPEELRDEVQPKNILMIGPTGVGKTEIARRLAKLAEAPFLKVEATKFTEVGYVGRDVEQIVRDLVEIAINMTRERLRKEVQAHAELNAEERLLDALVGQSAGGDTRQKFRGMLRKGELDDREVEVDISDSGGGQMPMFDMPGGGGQMGAINLNDLMKQMTGGRSRSRKLRVAEARDKLIEEEADNLLDQETLTNQAIRQVEDHGIVFLDEIDKITAGNARTSGDVSREGVQRDLLPMIEGTQVSTKHGTVKTDHILFIASGAFHDNKPADMLPELQGRLPIRVELDALSRDDFKRILEEPENSLIRQYKALIGTEEVTLDFTPDAIDALADLAAEINGSVENIGARRLHTVMERLLDEVSYTAADRAGETVRIDADYVHNQVADLARDTDLSRFIL
ncbi:ATP-dependent HslUV protease ATP-binding subunit HslU [Limimonas halophila]|uniref:ATP-dependent protease ATPase subunit HslU n=1 Tax=Limimonas halophila TaxID=1082479 RepID=A0A1G7RCR4_9PROT|nr:ATP-dependent protease ATPase subunit HslU [Limimonas halophila]SDG08454.1 ATP-dependent HslUV protease ATP-binding subunit HslU [Limimonas halophila]